MDEKYLYFWKYLNNQTILFFDYRLSKMKN